ncbi:MAG TPA: AAA family ATPase [Oligoflexia bacterium]|nr:AAA family ATPase [Oligoflexia bacterium]HMP49401.1 AAA family ATPase [Oligoflexia bacterium]
MSAIETIAILKNALTQVIKGREDTISLVLTGLIADGHVLLEDYPGSGKTTLAKTLGGLIDCSDEINNDYSSKSHSNAHILPFRRIQFTPDLLPSDVLGVNIFEPQSGTFRFQHGPIFAHVVLADEMNRTGPKVQAAFLECMAERQVTIDNATYSLDELFFVIGTQNPLDLAGTYPLPLVQLDRFLLKIPMKYVTADVELDILKKAEEIRNMVGKITPVVSRNAILDARREAASLEISEEIRKTIVNIVQETRSNPMFQYGASTRAALMFQKSLAAFALTQGRSFVTEDDLKFLAPFVLLHRLKIAGNAGRPEEVFNEFLKPHIEALVKRTL